MVIRFSGDLKPLSIYSTDSSFNKTVKKPFTLTTNDQK